MKSLRRTDEVRTDDGRKVMAKSHPGYGQVSLKESSRSNLSDCSYVEIHVPHATKLCGYNVFDQSESPSVMFL
jgi:hypothetical protein